MVNDIFAAHWAVLCLKSKAREGNRVVKAWLTPIILNNHNWWGFP